MTQGHGRGPIAVILGGTVTALSVARSLTDAGVAVHVLDGRNSPVRVSRLRAAFVDVGAEEMQPRMLDWLRSGPHGAVVLACSDEGLELIARHRAELVELGYRPMEADDEVLLAMLDKKRTEALARAHGIPVPSALPLRNQADVDAVSGEISYPCVLKPVHSHVFARTKLGAKVLTADSPEALQTEFERMSAIGVELLVVEVITGPDDEYVSYYSYLDEHGEPLLHFTKRKIRQHPNRFGTGTYHATTHDPEVADAGLRFLQAVGLRGLGNVEFKRDGRDGQLKLIECNARFTMSNELIRIAGIDLALFSYNRLLGRPTPPVDSYRDDTRLWTQSTTPVRSWNIVAAANSRSGAGSAACCIHNTSRARGSTTHSLRLSASHKRSGGVPSSPRCRERHTEPRHMDSARCTSGRRAPVAGASRWPLASISFARPARATGGDACAPSGACRDSGSKCATRCTSRSGARLRMS